MERKEILILGGGIGGLASANILAGKLKDKVKVTVIDKKKYFEFSPSFPWLMLGMREPDQVRKDLGILKKKGINVVQDEIISINPKNKTVETSKNRFTADFLVISMGASYNLNSIPGFREHTHHIYDLDSTLKFKEKLAKFRGGTIAIGISRLPFKCPAAPYEVAFLLERYFFAKGLSKNVRLEFFTPESNPVPSVGPDVGEEVLKLLGVRGINYHPKFKLTEVNNDEVIFDNGEAIRYDLLFAVPPHEAPKPLMDAGLTDFTGWINVNVETFQSAYDGIYAIGDVASVPTPNGYAPYLPKAGVFAHGQAMTVANNIASIVLGKNVERKWDGKGTCFLETGDGKSAYVKGQFLAVPRPLINFHAPGRVWHMQKVAFEKYWMRHWF